LVGTAVCDAGTVGVGVPVGVRVGFFVRVGFGVAVDCGVSVAVGVASPGAAVEGSGGCRPAGYSPK
jgi:hypothetical protein